MSSAARASAPSHPAPLAASRPWPPAWGLADGVEVLARAALTATLRAADTSGHTVRAGRVRRWLWEDADGSALRDVLVARGAAVAEAAGPGWRWLSEGDDAALVAPDAAPWAPVGLSADAATALLRALLGELRHWHTAGIVHGAVRADNLVTPQILPPPPVSPPSRPPTTAGAHGVGLGEPALWLRPAALPVARTAGLPEGDGAAWAPEQLDGTAEPGPAADVYAAAYVVASLALAGPGQPPAPLIHAPTAFHLRRALRDGAAAAAVAGSGLPEPLRDALMAALAPVPAERPSVDTLLDRLGEPEPSAGVPTSAPQDAPTPEEPREAVAPAHRADGPGEADDVLAQAAMEDDLLDEDALDPYDSGSLRAWEEPPDAAPPLAFEVAKRDDITGDVELPDDLPLPGLFDDSPPSAFDPSTDSVPHPAGGPEALSVDAALEPALPPPDADERPEDAATEADDWWLFEPGELVGFGEEGADGKGEAPPQEDPADLDPDERQAPFGAETADADEAEREPIEELDGDSVEILSPVAAAAREATDHLAATATALDEPGPPAPPVPVGPIATDDEEDPAAEAEPPPWAGGPAVRPGTPEADAAEGGTAAAGERAGSLGSAPRRAPSTLFDDSLDADGELPPAPRWDAWEHRLQDHGVSDVGIDPGESSLTTPLVEVFGERKCSGSVADPEQETVRITPLKATPAAAPGHEVLGPKDVVGDALPAASPDEPLPSPSPSLPPGVLIAAALIAAIGIGYAAVAPWSTPALDRPAVSAPAPSLDAAQVAAADEAPAPTLQTEQAGEAAQAEPEAPEAGPAATPSPEGPAMAAPAAEPDDAAASAPSAPPVRDVPPSPSESPPRAGAPAGSEPAAAQDAEAAPVGAAALLSDAAVADVTRRARAGDLTGPERDALAGVPIQSPNFTLARSLLYEDATARRDLTARRRHLDTLMELPAAARTPRFRLEEADVALAHGEALDALRICRQLDAEFARYAPTRFLPEYLRSLELHARAAEERARQGGADADGLRAEARDTWRVLAAVAAGHDADVVRRAAERARALGG